MSLVDHGRTSKRSLHFASLTRRIHLSRLIVLADLKVLEQQQRDSQLKLTNARQLMEQRNMQSTTLDSKLGSLKYANGELRAQITQYRESLSVSNRSLGSRKLIAERASGDIRNFEKGLKKGLMSSRVNASILSKIDSVLILLTTKVNTVARVKSALKSKISAFESELVSQTQKDESTRNAVHQQVVRFQEGANKLAIIRTESIGFEKDFLTAQNMEQTTRTQTNTLKAEMTIASQQTQEELTSLLGKMEETSKNSDALDHDNAALASELESHLEVLNEIQSRQDPIFDGVKAKARLDVSQNQVEALSATNRTLQEESEKMTAEIVEDSEAAARKLEESRTIVNAAKELLTSEQARADELKAFNAELEAERHSLVRLDKSSRELKDTRNSAATEQEQVLLQCDQEQEKTQRDISRLRQLIEQGTASHESCMSAWNTSKADLLARLGKSQASYKLVESVYNETERKLNDVNIELEENLRKELSVLKNNMAETAKRHDASVSAVLQSKSGACDVAHTTELNIIHSFFPSGHPMLQSIVSGFVLDGSMSYEDHSKVALASLKEDLRNMIREKRDAKKSEQENRKNAENKLKRNEESRRKNRERIEAEIKQQEVFLKDSTHAPASEPPKRSMSHPEGLTRTRKSADFFNPASQDDISEEETPAQPKSLLPTFAHARSLSRKSSFDLTPSSNKHVHWKEEKVGGEQAEKGVAGRETNESRKPKYYGTSQRGLAAISRPKKSDAEKRSVAILDAGSDSDHDVTSDTLRASDETKRKHRKSLGGKLNGTGAERYTAREADSKPHATLAGQESAVSELATHHSQSTRSRNESEGLLERRAERRQEKSKSSFGSKSNKPSSRQDASLKMPSTSNPKCPEPNSANDHLSCTQEEKNRRSNFASSRSRNETTAKSSSVSLHSKSPNKSRPPVQSSSRSMASEASRNSGTSKSSIGSKKRKTQKDISSTQTSGLSSAEGIHKIRRRNKSSGLQRTSMTVTDDAYSFAF